MEANKSESENVPPRENDDSINKLQQQQGSIQMTVRNSVAHQFDQGKSGEELEKLSSDDDEDAVSNSKFAPSSSTRPYEIVIFAASSSVGKFLVEEIALVVEKFYPSSQNSAHPNQMSSNTLGIREQRDTTAPNRRLSVPRHVDGIRWAIAGRSAVKLNETLCRAELSTGIKDLAYQVPFLLADLNHYKSLLDMCSKTNLIINCAGPYSVASEYLIKACIDSKTNYIDLSHETTFIEQIRLKYSTRASQAGIYIINGCGFQSMSAEMGLNFTKQVVDGQIDEVKIVLTLSNSRALVRPSGSRTRIKSSGIVSKGMWNSLLVERTNQFSSRELSLIDQDERRRQFSVRPVEESSSQAEDGQLVEMNSRPVRKLKRKDTQSLVKDLVEFRNRNSLIWLQLIRGFEECGRGYCLPMNGLTSEESQLIRGEMANYELRRPDLNSVRGWRPIRCTSFFSLKALSEVFFLLLWLIIFNFITKFSYSRWFLKKFPLLSSVGQVSSAGKELDRDSLSHIKFCQTFLAYGTPGEDSGDPLEQREKHLKRKQVQLLVARVVGPEPNHVATATYAIQAALTLTLEKDHLPAGGGVLTPGAAFSETNIIYQLRRRNIKFEVLKKA